MAAPSRPRRLIAAWIILAVLALWGGIVPPASAAPGDFISTWDTRRTTAGSSAENQLKLPLLPDGSYDFTVDWGDATPQGTVSSWDDPDALHTYTAAGTYTVSISGTLQGWSFNDTGDRDKLLDIAQWGTMRLGNGGFYFSGARSLQITATDAPDLSGTTSLRGMFWGADAFNSQIGHWDVSTITDMLGMFAFSDFNADISGWNVANVRNMSQMFWASPFNRDISGWDVSNVTNMGAMFYDTTAFNQNLGSLERQQRHRHALDVLLRTRLRPGPRELERQQRHHHGPHVQGRSRVQPEPRELERQQRH